MKPAPRHISCEIAFLALFAATLAGNWGGMREFAERCVDDASEWGGRNFRGNGEHTRGYQEEKLRCRFRWFLVILCQDSRIKGYEQPILRSIIAGVALCLFSANPVAAGSAANDHLTVSCSLPRVVVTVDNTQFDVFAPGYTNLFEGDVNVAAINGWTLVDPSAAELPLKMKGGDVEPYAVTRPPEDARAGTIYFHNYCIMSDQDDGAKYIGVAPGVTVKYTAYKNGGKCPSDWTVNGQTKKNTTSIIFNRDWWDVPEWLTPSMKTPKPGIYVIDAHDVNSNVLKDDGEMAVFGADFVEDGGHIYGFTSIP